jgi:hypothetical protein
MKTEFVQAGPEEIDFKYYEDTLKLIRAKKVVYWYQSGSYDGSGTAVIVDEDNNYHEIDLGHCSCYGPLDDLANPNLIGNRKAFNFWLKNDGVRDRNENDYDYERILAIKKAFTKSK